MSQPALVIIKPDGISKALVGNIFTKLFRSKLELVTVKLVKVNKELAESHYQHIKGTPFYDGTIEYFMGKIHKQPKVMVMVFRGKDSIAKLRKIAGVTNPEEAHPESIRGAYGRITTRGIYENLVHVSENKKDAEREIKLWFKPEEIPVNLYPTRTIVVKSVKQKSWA